MDATFVRAVKATSLLSVHHTCNPQQATRRLCPSIRCLHTTSTKDATPVTHPTILAPPPGAPQASPSQPQDRVARKREQLAALRQNEQAKVNPSKPTTALRKRFWKNVSVTETDEGLEVHLDKRPVRTAMRQVLRLPKSKRALAGAIALEWDLLVSAQQAMKQHYIPLTSLTSRAFDLQAADAQHGVDNQIRQNIITVMMRYLGTDTLLCWAPEVNRYSSDKPGVKPLRQKQKEVAEPIIAFLTTHVFPGVEIVPILGEDSIVPISQPEMTRQVIRGWLSGLPAFELAALERGVLATKSLLVAVRLMVEWSSEFGHLRPSLEDDILEADANSDRFDIENASEAANLEVLHQTEQWGEVEDTHDVDKEDVRRQLGSVVLLVA